jgi:Phage integrase family
VLPPQWGDGGHQVIVAGHHRGTRGRRGLARMVMPRQHLMRFRVQGVYSPAVIQAPGSPVASWSPAVPGRPFTPPSGRGTPRLVGTGGTGHCPSCRHAVRLRLDGTIVTHKTKNESCPGGGQQPAAGAPLACWLPVKDGLTPHGLRHSHKTWMAEDGIPEVLAEQRLGHDVPRMRGLYAHGLTADEGGPAGGASGPLGGIAAGARRD